MEDTKELITTDDIRSKVYIIRGQQVMLDKDLAEILSLIHIFLILLTQEIYRIGVNLSEELQMNMRRG